MKIRYGLVITGKTGPLYFPTQKARDRRIRQIRNFTPYTTFRERITTLKK